MVNLFNYKGTLFYCNVLDVSVSVVGAVSDVVKRGRRASEAAGRVVVCVGRICRGFLLVIENTYIPPLHFFWLRSSEPYPIVSSDSIYLIINS